MDETVHMDPSIWSKTPGDIIFLIIEASDRATQISWSSTRRVFYNYLCPRIWSHLEISPFDIDGYAGNPELWWWPGLKERHGKIHFMAKHASRENELARMGSYIESLLVDVRSDLTPTLPNQPAASQLSLEIAIPKLLPLLPNLTSCVFDGALYRETLSQLVHISALKRLELRADDWYLQQGCSYLDESRSWVWRRWSDLVLDFRVLANLKSLQSLKVGRLQHHEARGLAEGVARLRLVNLEIHSSPWVNDEDPRHYLAGGKTYDSPLMFFFYSLIHRYDSNLLPSALPSTIETLILRDRFHAFGKPTKQNYLRAACRDCRSLRRIESTHPTREQACKFLVTFGWQPVEERFGETKLASLKTPEESLGKIYNGVAELRHMPSPGLWKFAVVRDPDDDLESAEDYEKNRSEDSAGLRAAVNDSNTEFNTEFRTINLEKLT
ncbi:MAG: hypothetical protein Q9161_006492 [Pseudevernia consocians]